MLCIWTFVVSLWQMCVFKNLRSFFRLKCDWSSNLTLQPLSRKKKLNWTRIDRNSSLYDLISHSDYLIFSHQHLNLANLHFLHTSSVLGFWIVLCVGWIDCNFFSWFFCSFDFWWTRKCIDVIGLRAKKSRFRINLDLDHLQDFTRSNKWNKK